MKAKQENRLSEQKNFSSHCRIYRLKNRIVRLVIWASVVGLIAYLIGVSVIYVVVGLLVAKLIARLALTVVIAILVYILIYVLIFGGLFLILIS